MEILGTGKPVVVANSILSGRAIFRLDANRVLVAEHSLVGTLAPHPLTGDMACEVVLKHSILWSPQVDGACLTTASAQKLKVTAQATLFESGNALIVGPAPVTWNGSRNVYRIGSRNGADTQASEADSLVLDPLVFDPLQWRLLAQSPGYRTGAGGKDCGADVDHVAAPATFADGKK